MVKSEPYILSILKTQLKQIRAKYPETRKRGGIQKYIYKLISDDLAKISHEEYLGLAKEVAKK